MDDLPHTRHRLKLQLQNKQLKAEGRLNNSSKITARVSYLQGYSSNVIMQHTMLLTLQLQQIFVGQLSTGCRLEQQQVQLPSLCEWAEGYIHCYNGKLKMDNCKVHDIIVCMECRN